MDAAPAGQIVREIGSEIDRIGLLARRHGIQIGLGIRQCRVQRGDIQDLRAVCRPNRMKLAAGTVGNGSCLPRFKVNDPDIGLMIIVDFAGVIRCKRD